MDNANFYIIGMSPGNSYFKDKEVYYLMKSVEQFGRVAIFIPDIPAISTYVALGYPENRARRDKAIPQGNALKNRVYRAMDKLGCSGEVVKIFNWREEIENNHAYRQKYGKVTHFYKNNTAFREATNLTTQGVLEATERTVKDIEKAIGIAVHYLLSEIAFCEFVPSYLGVKKVTFVYHKNCKTLEDYIDGKFDGVVKEHLGFLIIRS